MSIAAVDIGGTHTRVARIKGDGMIAERREVPTQPDRGSEVALRELGDLVETVLDGAADELEGIGLSVTGPVDVAAGIVDNPYTLAGWGAVDIVSPLRQRFGVPAQLLNDADAAAVGEWVYGAGRDVRRLVMVTIGTGIGMGAVIDGVLQHRHDGAHAEAGHHLIAADGPPCSCGAYGCWESLASGQALLRLAREHAFIASPHITHVNDPDAHARAQAAAVIASAEANEPRGQAIINEIARWLGVGLVNTAAFLIPDAIIIGGGLGERCFDLMHPTVTEVLQRHRGMVRTDIALRKATAGDDAGLLGAARAVISSRAQSQRDD